MSQAKRFTIRNSAGCLITEWESKRAAISACKAMKDRGEHEFYAVDENNAEIIWSFFE